MKLDSRIIEGKRPLTCFDIDEAEQFRGKDGYFAHEIEVFENLDCCYFSRLLGFDTCDKSIPFAAANASRDYEFFIPEEWTKEPEKKYRPLSYKEFWRLFDFGDGVCFRRKGQNIAEFSMFLGYEIDSDRTRAEIPGEGKVNLGGNRYTLAELFEYYELELDDEWQPFGVIDE